MYIGQTKPYVFVQHVTSEGMALVKQAEDAASNKKVHKTQVRAHTHTSVTCI